MSLLSCALDAPVPTYNLFSLSLLCSRISVHVQLPSCWDLLFVSCEVLGKSLNICHPQFLYCKTEIMMACIQHRVIMKLKCDNVY